MWQVTGDMWQVTRDRWQVTGDMWHVTHSVGWSFQSTLVSLDVTTEHLTPLHSWLESLSCLHGACWTQDFWQRSSLRGKVEERDVLNSPLIHCTSVLHCLLCTPCTLSGDDCTLFPMEDDDLTTGLLLSPVFTCRQLRPTEIDCLPVWPESRRV